ncbi:MAG: molecular chaperone HtpG [Bacteroidales bacterium]|jgi:molecular chaperone HtpG|nr:molecular chaperone HtpG [Bacteroidales bacterium]MDD4214577.1 molecular chaperone HtpG [Bacteroidales bacterium]
MQKGKINVQTENIFPIIKKFLYSDHDIFLRELISNAVDATQKLKVLSSLGKYKDELGDLTIQVKVDEKKKTLSVIDRGIGMTAEELDKYINQIAFSSAEEFVKTYMGKSETDQKALIGHFGLGFYSAFMVSKKVEIRTKTYQDEGDTKAMKWVCDGSPEYTMTEIKNQPRGTEIILYLSEDSEEYAQESRVLEILKKYCKFLPVSIQFGMQKTWEKVEGEKDKDGNDKSVEVENPRIINNVSPAWTKKPADLKEEDYNSFYHELYPMNFEEPMFYIHLNVDYPFKLTGILYFPKVKRNFEVQRDKIQLYCNQVFVTDSVEGIVPDFLTLLHGVLDSPDIPLNVSRSYLQSDPNVKKISSHIMKKVADKLEELFKNKREDFEKKWDDLKIFIIYGMVTDEKFYERAEKFFLFKNTKDKYFTIEEYKKHIEPLQTDKDKKLVYLYASDKEEQHGFISAAYERGYDVLVMDSPLDMHFVNMIEHKMDNSSFARVDSDTLDKLVKKEEAAISKINEDEKNKLKEIIERNIPKEKFQVVFESLQSDDMPFTIVQPEFLRRMKDMAAIGSSMPFMSNYPEMYNLVVNTNNDFMLKILNEAEESKQNDLIKQFFDLAKLAQNLLKGEDLTGFIKRSISLIV